MEDVTFPFNHNTFNSILGGLVTSHSISFSKLSVFSRAFFSQHPIPAKKLVVILKYYTYFTVDYMWMLHQDTNLKRESIWWEIWFAMSCISFITGEQG